MKTCPKCLKFEPEVTFGIARSRYDGKAPYCRACWTLYIQQGRWAKGTKRTPPFLERLWEGIQICAHGIDCPFCCWPWLKARDKDGYGKFSLPMASGKPRSARATRVLYEIHHGIPLETDQLICHYCDSPPCCNYYHFWIGDRISNRQDCVTKGRQAIGGRTGQVLHPELFPHGEQHHLSRLTEKQVLEIRATYPSISANRLAQLHGVSKHSVLSIIHRKSWKHI